MIAESYAKQLGINELEYKFFVAKEKEVYKHPDTTAIGGRNTFFLQWEDGKFKVFTLFPKKFLWYKYEKRYYIHEEFGRLAFITVVKNLLTEHEYRAFKAMTGKKDCGLKIIPTSLGEIIQVLVPEEQKIYSLRELD